MLTSSSRHSCSQISISSKAPSLSCLLASLKQDLGMNLAHMTSSIKQYNIYIYEGIRETTTETISDI